MALELAITGGSLIDGTGATARRADVGIQAGRIVSIGTDLGPAERTIAASGLAVAPGFIDIHTHYDAQILWDRMLTISPWHGVTTVVMGNCGFGVAPTRPAHRGIILRTLEKVEGMSLECLQAGVGTDWPFETFPQYLDAVERSGSVINVAALLGHTPLRLYVLGEEATERTATPNEVATMRRLVREAIDAGALGFATSKSPTHVGFAGKPVPSRAADLDEITALVGVLGEAKRGVMQATVGPGFFFDEFAALARATHVPITWTALLAGMLGPGSHRMLLARSLELTHEGLPIVPQVACRPLNFEFDMQEPFVLESLPVFHAVSAADRAGKIRLYRDAAFRRGFIDTVESEMAGPFPGMVRRTVISYAPHAPALEGRNLVAVAQERGVHPVEALLDIALESDLVARFRAAVMNYDEDEVAELLQNPYTVIGLSDAGAHASQLCDACFSTHLLGHWVREKRVLGLEDAVRMLTARPAEVMGISDRGRLATGLAADVVVFDPATVGASPLRRVHDLPAGAPRLVSDATGIEALVVNGKLVRQHGRDVVDAKGPLPGRVLRGGRAA